MDIKKILIWAVISYCSILTMARGEEPNWDKVVPIIIQIESSGNPNAISKDGCIGLMQISPMVLYEYNKEIWIRSPVDLIPNLYKTEDLYSPFLNKAIGTWYLKRIWTHYLPHYKLDQSIDNLLIAYNFGIGNLVKYRQGKIKLALETANYIKHYKQLAKKK